MSRLIEGLARRLVESEAVPRRDLLTGRRAAAAAGVVVPLAGAVARPGRSPPGHLGPGSPLGRRRRLRCLGAVTCARSTSR